MNWAKDMVSPFYFYWCFMIYRVFDIDGTLVQFDEVTVYDGVLAYIKSLDLSENSLFFLTARWNSYYDMTYAWLVELLGHTEFKLICRPSFDPFSMAKYKCVHIDKLMQENPKELHFYDDCFDNIHYIERYRKQHEKKDFIFIYEANEGSLHEI